MVNQYLFGNDETALVRGSRAAAGPGGRASGWLPIATVGEVVGGGEERRTQSVQMPARVFNVVIEEYLPQYAITIRKDITSIQNYFSSQFLLRSKIMLTICY